ncbi:hypothetical protein [Ruminococcus sp.]|uniref:hypothetical protein n=1 Tax=Ruminococcus sp. TaxID=41978 RepID=UPI001B5690CF|nr:hypothetical protein [Ruminococcus sp.]MBP5432123.1 hypothetical protein [Ruminococcus sp.]
MQMTDGEVVMNVMQAKDQRGQITICADLNCCSEEKIKDILKAQGVDLRSLKGAAKPRIPHGVKHKPHKKPANAEKKSPLAELNERIDSLVRQRAGIDDEINYLKAELTKMIDMLTGRSDE